MVARALASRALCAALALVVACSASDGADDDGLDTSDAGHSTRADRPPAASDRPATAPPGDGGGADTGATSPTDAPTPLDAPRPLDGGTTTGPGCGASEVCGDGLDNNCNGVIDERCVCAPGASRRCFPGAPGLAGVGTCTYGMQTCTGTGEFGTWAACEGAGTPSPETCDRADNDCDGAVDEGLLCDPCIMGMSTTSPWQMHRMMGPICFGRSFGSHGEAGEYEFARVPTEGDPGWRPVSAATIDFSEMSALCGRSCQCRDGGEFTYFQTFFDVPDGYAVSDFSLTMGRVDDGARVSVYNSRYPSGIVETGSYVYLGGSGTSTNLARYIVTGRNRIVITHIDDCCSERYLTGVRVVINGRPAGACMR